MGERSKRLTIMEKKKRAYRNSVQNYSSELEEILKKYGEACGVEKIRKEMLFDDFPVIEIYMNDKKDEIIIRETPYGIWIEKKGESGIFEKIFKRGKIPFHFVKDLPSTFASLLKSCDKIKLDGNYEIFLKYFDDKEIKYNERDGELKVINPLSFAVKFYKNLENASHE